MTEPDSSSPLRSLHEVATPLRSSEREEHLRQRVVARIAALQVELCAHRELEPLAVPASAWQRALAAWKGLGERVAASRLAVVAAGAVLAAAAALAFVLLGRPQDVGLRLEAGRVFIESSSGKVLPRGGERFALGKDDAMVTETDSAELQLPSHAALSMSPHSMVRVQVVSLQNATQEPATEDHLRLERGVVSLRVPKLAAGQHLTVATSDALVEVHGTEFSVERVDLGGGALATRVRVKEGVVSVTVQTSSAGTGAPERVLLTAGQNWVSAAAASVAFATPSAAGHESVPIAPAPSEPPAPSESPAPNGVPSGSALGRSSDLAAQNELFLSAREARNSGATALALQRLAALMQRYPASELAHNARVEQFRILKAAGRLNEARASARQYLRQYPNGFARVEATKLSAP
jgi:TolA-binding protein